MFLYLFSKMWVIRHKSVLLLDWSLWFSDLHVCTCIVKVLFVFSVYLVWKLANEWSGETSRHFNDCCYSYPLQSYNVNTYLPDFLGISLELAVNNGCQLWTSFLNANDVASMMTISGSPPQMLCINTIICTEDTYLGTYTINNIILCAMANSKKV